MDERFRHALDLFASRMRRNPRVIGIIATGSVDHSKPDKNSDLDVFVLLDKSKTRERGNTWIDGVEVEYFLNPVNQVRHEFKEERASNSAATAYMFAKGIVIFSKSKIVDALVKEAKSILNTKPKAISAVQRENGKYYIDDDKKDLEDMYLKKDSFAFHRAANSLLDECLKFFYACKRVRQTKNKRLEAHLKSIDPRFARLFIRATTVSAMTEKYRAVNKVAEYVEKLLGGARSKEWKLRGPLSVK